jgi:hypothetical protein
VLCVGILTGPVITDVTYNSVSLVSKFDVTFFNAAFGATFRSAMWCMAGPASGANTVVVTFAASSGYALSAVSYTDVNQATPFGTASTNTGSGDAPQSMWSRRPGKW